MPFVPELRPADPGLRPVAREVALRARVFTEALSDVDDELARLAPTVGDGVPGFAPALDGWRHACLTVVEELIGMLEAMGVDAADFRRRWSAAARQAPRRPSAPAVR